jgi:hypothetical protein
VLVISPLALLRPAAPQPEGTLVYELVTGHPDREPREPRKPRELVFPADLAVELRAWPYGTWARLGVDLQAAAAAVIAAWWGGHVKACGSAG